MRQPFFQAVNLEREDFFTALRQIVSIGRNKRQGCDQAVQVESNQMAGEGDAATGAAGRGWLARERVLTAPFLSQHPDIRIGEDQPCAEQPGLSQPAPVLIDQVVPGKDEICCRFTFAGISIDIRTDQPG